MKLIIGLDLILLVSSVFGYKDEMSSRDCYRSNDQNLEVCYNRSNIFIEVNELNDFPSKTLKLELYGGTNNTITPYQFNNSHIGFMMVVESTSSWSHYDYVSPPQLSLSKDSFAGMLELEELGLYYIIVNFNDENPFARLELLKVLTLREIGSEGIPLKMLASLPKLEKLDLAVNWFDTIHPNSFASLKNLETLDLSRNRITYIKPGAFNGLSELKELTLNHNDFDLEAGMFQGMPKLNILKLNESLSRYVTVLENSVFDDLPELTELYLSNNRLEYISTGVFEKLASLKTLDLSHNGIQYIPPSTFRNLKSLSYIDLGFNDLGSVTGLFGVFSGLELDTLILRGNEIYTIQTDVLKDLRIRNLDLSENEIGNEASGGFNGLTVETLNLTSNRLSTIDSNYFKGLHSKNLALTRNNILFIWFDSFKDIVTEKLYVNPIFRMDFKTRVPGVAIDRAEWGVKESVTIVSDYEYVRSS